MLTLVQFEDNWKMNALKIQLDWNNTCIPLIKDIEKNKNVLNFLCVTDTFFFS